MNIYELRDCEMNTALAYVLGLMYPLYNEKELNGKKYILGSINHNSQMITQDQLNEHFLKVDKLLKKYEETKHITLKTNKCAEYSISNKKGFSVLIENTNVSEEESNEILTDKVKQIKSASDEIKIEFVKGCFDGRASWDKTIHFLSIDVDRNYDKQDLIEEIINSLGIDVNKNRRHINHKKHDQIRIKPKSLRTYMQKVNFYSVCREKIINNQINI